MHTTEFIEQLGDSDFQDALLANPRQALVKVGVEVPATIEVKAVRNSKDNAYVVIPAHSAEAITLSDDELGQLSAGDFIVATVVGIGVATIVAGLAAAIGLTIANSLGTFD